MGRSVKDIAKRLEETRGALEKTAAELCREAGIKPNAWSQWTSDNPDKVRKITLAGAYKLKDTYGVTLEWIYDGDLSTLPGRLITKIKKAA